MTDKVKNGTSLFRFYELVVLQKIQNSKPKKKQAVKPAKCEPEILCDCFGQMIYSLTVKPGLE
ncbi:hypothetical protein [Desulforamulus putei]|uniref:Uncharacterized protein n=1 Tax=Desulforamulus putei DSM 12395 TaxID=1121429 RepID=A0A1M4YL05_9FIRM|nr:hypothetical protein [Desulforamulus putei]SHF06449.1 hypothetical protein SAMN02745133_01726 [Desulforamulus putei DSM 12395]